MKTCSAFWFLTIALSLVACGAASEDETTRTTGNALVDDCTGEYECVRRYRSTSATRTALKRQGDTCLAYGAYLTADHNLDGFPGDHWSGDKSGFDYTIDGEMVTCKPATFPAGTCSGTATRCGTKDLDYGACSALRGCWNLDHFHSSNWSTDYSCEGTADACETFNDDPGGCKAQGCTWQ